MRRTEARVQALEALYAADARGDLGSLDGLSARARRFAEGVWEHRNELDEEIASVSIKWRTERMPVVDRNLLRLGLYELRHSDTPVGVVISEMVDLAKAYSTTRSAPFVNGVLARLVESVTEIAVGSAQDDSPDGEKEIM